MLISISTPAARKTAAPEIAASAKASGNPGTSGLGRKRRLRIVFSNPVFHKLFDSQVYFPIHNKAGSVAGFLDPVGQAIAVSLYFKIHYQSKLAEVLARLGAGQHSAGYQL
jgi:hypothetical protein